MPTLNEVLAYRQAMYERSVALVATKGHDYNRVQQSQGDTLFNLRSAALLGIVDSPERGVLVRLLDKLMRLASLVDSEPDVQESFEDTILDAHNYLDYVGILREERLNGDVRLRTSPTPSVAPEAPDQRAFLEQVLQALRTWEPAAAYIEQHCPLWEGVAVAIPPGDGFHMIVQRDKAVKTLETLRAVEGLLEALQDAYKGT